MENMGILITFAKYFFINQIEHKGREIYMKNIIIFLITAWTLFLLADKSLAAGPWRGKLIDIETKEPLENAVVVAVWYRVWRTPAGGVSSVYTTKEVLTNKEGRFEMPSYTPINLMPILSYMRGPEFTIFKPGYLSLSGVDFSEFFMEGAKEEPLERKEISGKIFRLAPGIIELPKLQTKEERENARMTADIFGADFDKKDLPLLYEMVNEEKKSGF